MDGLSKKIQDVKDFVDERVEALSRKQDDLADSQDEMKDQIEDVQRNITGVRLIAHNGAKSTILGCALADILQRLWCCCCLGILSLRESVQRWECHIVPSGHSCLPCAPYIMAHMLCCRLRATVHLPSCWLYHSRHSLSASLQS